jgi:hypothetical protein
VRRPGGAAAAKARFLPAEIPRFQPPVGSIGPRHPFGELLRYHVLPSECC